MTAITEYTLGNFDANYAAVEVPDTDGVRLVLSHPAADENLWEEYLCGAWEAYERYGAQAALDVPAVRDGISTSLFYALVDDGGGRGRGTRAGTLRLRFSVTCCGRMGGQQGSRRCT